MAARVEKPIPEIVQAFKNGESVQIASKESQTVKYLSRYIGTDGKRLFITELPTPRQLKRDSVRYNELFFPGHNFVMRLVFNGVVYAFESAVIGLFHKEGNLLLSSFPKTIHQRVLRKESRYACTLLSKFEVAAQEVDGVITNISLSGCQLLINSRESEALLKPLENSGSLVVFKVFFPYEDGEQVIDGEVKSIKLGDNQSLVLGILFNGDTSVVKRYFDVLHLEDIPLSS